MRSIASAAGSSCYGPAIRDCATDVQISHDGYPSLASWFTVFSGAHLRDLAARSETLMKPTANSQQVPNARMGLPYRIRGFSRRRRSNAEKMPLPAALQTRVLVVKQRSRCSTLRVFGFMISEAAFRQCLRSFYVLAGNVTTSILTLPSGIAGT